MTFWLASAIVVKIKNRKVRMVFPSLQEFRKAVIVMTKSGTPFMRAVQLLFDEVMGKFLAEANWSLSCHEGCPG